GHCTVCLDGPVGRLPAPRPAPIDVDRDALAALVEAHPAALAEPRQRARLLCGITSPATTRTRLTRDPLFGALRDRPFAAILDWCVAGSGASAIR
ncbi:MAG: ATP-dependent helicase RecQ, partial [Gaiellaceae bacterium]|nr:ATP-dependent helicase RecQ [Gaiellaceae bacterium]